MCTLSVLTRDDGYFLAMNRDEQMTRGPATSPARIDLGGANALYPRDSAGGTWIAANDHGIAFGLLNWHDVARPRAKKTRSRGEVIPALVRCSSHHDVQTAFAQFDFRGILPFRLIGVFPKEREIHEWRWDRSSVSAQVHPWVVHHWFSSGVSDEQAAVQRGAVCRSAAREGGAGSLAWLRRLHASHVNGPGPFSLCVHRENVRTLSYTELICTREKVECNYFSGSPCTMQGFQSSTTLERVPALAV
jgi:hypothetical protein